jgi:hypothetical protein
MPRNENRNTNSDRNPRNEDRRSSGSKKEDKSNSLNGFESEIDGQIEPNDSEGKEE